MKLRRILTFFAVFIGLVALGGWFVLRASLPQVEGEITISGLTAPVTIARDANGVPHISAENDLDLQRALGFAHAQDRLWQMEMNRRIGSGRLSEVVGSQGLSADKYMRTIGFRSRAEVAYNQLDESSKQILLAYADGVNKAIEHIKVLPPEFIITGHSPEPWDVIDSLIWQKMMWQTLSQNIGREFIRAEILAAMTKEQLSVLFPTYPGEKPLPWPSLEDLYAKLPTEALAARFPAAPSSVGSNNWVISGDLTKSGKPLLANDPHLGMTTPAIWYLARLHNTTDNTNIVGVTFPGLPGIVLGRNDHIAWGVTNTGGDVQDSFVEKLVSADTYLTPDGPKPFETREEVIRVRFGDPVTITVRETRHGPVISDIMDNLADQFGDEFVVSVRWSALDDKDSGLLAFTKIGKARSYEEFVKAGQTFLGPQQNMIYADVEGNIGYHAPAHIPMRRDDNPVKGRLPSPGWLSLYDWQGYIPLDEVPKRFNPESGVIATANERIVDDTYPHYLTNDWSLPYRGNRIRSELAKGAPHDRESFRQLQQDVTSDMVRDLKPLLLGLMTEQHPLLDEMRDWDGTLSIDSRPALVFKRWILLTQEKLIADEMGDIYQSLSRNRSYIVRPHTLKSVLYWAQFDIPPVNPPYFALPPAPKEASQAWCDDVNTDTVEESCADQVAAAFQATLDELKADYGADMDNWRWGDAHMLVQRHNPFTAFPVLRDFFTLQAPQAGGTATINVGGDSSNPANRHQSGHAASYRGVFDLNDLEASGYIHSTGQSGHPLSPHYDDLFPKWLAGDLITIPTAEKVPEGSHVLTLQPSR